MTPSQHPTSPLVKAPRTVIGYHGCSRESAKRILAEGRFLPSTKAYDWLGEEVYFWEYAPYRALDWAIQKCALGGGEPAIIRVTVRLGRCLNLLDTEHIPGLVKVYGSFVETIGAVHLPRNTERGAHYLDRAIIDAYCRVTKEETATPLQTVRGSFAEGEPLYPGSKIRKKAHTQIAVRDETCISRLFLVEFP